MIAETNPGESRPDATNASTSDSREMDPAAGSLHFEDGIPGFPEQTRFALVNFVEDGAFQMLQSVDDPDVAMVVANPWMFFPDYEPELTELDQIGLEIVTAEDAVVFCPVSVGEDGILYMNLLGPFVVNARTRRARQVVLIEGGHTVRTPIPAPVS